MESSGFFKELDIVLSNDSDSGFFDDLECLLVTDSARGQDISPNELTPFNDFPAQSEYVNDEPNEFCGEILALDGSNPFTYNDLSQQKQSNIPDWISKPVEPPVTDPEFDEWFASFGNLPPIESDEGKSDSLGDNLFSSQPETGFYCHEPENNNKPQLAPEFGNVTGGSILCQLKMAVGNLEQMNGKRVGAVGHVPEELSPNSNSDVLLTSGNSSVETDTAHVHSPASSNDPAKASGVHVGDETKKLRRLLRNRASATESRLRKKSYVSDLENKCRNLEAQLMSMRQLASLAATENGLLREQLIRFQQCYSFPTGAGASQPGVKRAFPQEDSLITVGGDIECSGDRAEPAVLKNNSLPLEFLPLQMLHLALPAACCLLVFYLSLLSHFCSFLRPEFLCLPTSMGSFGTRGPRKAKSEEGSSAAMARLHSWKSVLSWMPMELVPVR